MHSRVLEHGPTKAQQRLYDLIREVVAFHVAFPDPPLLPTTGGSFRVIRSP
jgi:hypothetical protein